MSTWTKVSGRTAYENPWIRVVADQVVRPDGSDGIYGVVELHHPAVFVVALDEHDGVLLVDVDRYTVGPSIEVPAGGSDGQDPVIGARRELLEETGFVADDWEQIGVMNALNGIARASATVFLARNLRKVDDGHDRAAEGIGAVRWVPWSEAVAMVAAGQITDSETIASLMFAATRLDRVG